MLLNFREFDFDLRDDGWQSAAAVARFVLDTVPLIRIVARGDENAARGRTLANEQRNRGRGTRLVGKPNGRAGRGNHFSDRGGYAVGRKAVVVADQHAFARILATNDVACDGSGCNAGIRKREAFGDHVAPAICSKFYRGHKGQWKVYAKRYIRHTARLD